VLGGAEALAQKPRWNELVTTEPAVYLVGSREAMIDMLEDDTEVGLQFMSMLATYLLFLWDRKAMQGVTPDSDRAMRPAG
jgi:hypothetical protein